jgi:hypothetical protein
MRATAGVGLTGSAGLSLQRTDAWSDTMPRFGGNQLWFTGSLALDAAFFGPGVLDLGASASYLGYRAQGGSASDALNYRLTLAALRNTPVSVNAGASRTNIDFSADSGGGRTGSTRVDSRSGSLFVGTSGTPTLAASIYQNDTTNRSIGLAPVRSSDTTVRADLSQAVEGLNYSLTYDTRWAAGDYAETNYRTHVGTLRAQAQLATNATAQVAATYTLRLPTLESPLNPRIDSQYVSAWTQWVADQNLSAGGGYTYSNSLFDAPGSPLRQNLSHSVSAYGSHQLSVEWGYSLNASASVAEAHVGTAETKASGEGVGANARWARRVGDYALSATADTSIGIFQPDTGKSQTAYAYGAGFSASRPLGSWYGSAGLSANREENASASAGSRTSLRGSAGASGYPFGWSFSSQLDVGYSHSDSPTFGTSGYTSALLSAQAYRSGYALLLSAGMNDQASEFLAPGSVPGSMVPVDFNTRATFGSLTATVPTAFNLFLSLTGRYSWVSMPGRPTQWERGLGLNVAYYFGAFQFSLYDLLSSGGVQGGASGNQNLIFFSVTRSFGR